jgi:hypothetical protein
MAFKHASTLACTAPFEYYLGTDAEDYTRGEALVMTAGRLTKCDATATPEFICQKNQAAEATAVTLLPVIRVTELQEYEVNVGAATPTSIPLGAKVTLHTDGLSVTDTVTGGVFLVSGNPKGAGNVAVGDKITGYFRR